MRPTPNAPWNMVRLSRYSPSLSLGSNPATPLKRYMMKIISTANQYAGYSRDTRETANSPTVCPQTLIRMTNPLMRKNSSTPRMPSVVRRATGSNSLVGYSSHSDLLAAMKWKDMTANAATNRRTSSSTRRRPLAAAAAPRGRALSKALPEALPRALSGPISGPISGPLSGAAETGSDCRTGRLTGCLTGCPTADIRASQERSCLL